MDLVEGQAGDGGAGPHSERGLRDGRFVFWVQFPVECIACCRPGNLSRSLSKRVAV